MTTLVVDPDEPVVLEHELFATQMKNEIVQPISSTTTTTPTTIEEKHDPLRDGFYTATIPWPNIVWRPSMEVKKAPGCFMSFYSLAGLAFGNRIMGILYKARTPLGFSIGYNPNETCKWGIMVSIEDEDDANSLREADKYLKVHLAKLFGKKNDKRQYVPLLKEGEEKKDSTEKYAPTMKFTIELDPSTMLPTMTSEEGGKKVSKPGFDFIVDGKEDLSRFGEYKADKEKKIMKPFSCDLIWAIKQAYSAGQYYGVSIYLTQVKVLEASNSKQTVNKGRFPPPPKRKVVPPTGVEAVDKRPHTEGEEAPIVT